MSSGASLSAPIRKYPSTSPVTGNENSSTQRAHDVFASPSTVPVTSSASPVFVTSTCQASGSAKSYRSGPAFTTGTAYVPSKCELSAGAKSSEGIGMRVASISGPRRASWR